MRGGFPLLVAALSWTCGQAEESRSPDTEAAFGEAFDLSLAEQAEVAGEVRLAFSRVSEDSRCPEGARCAQAGNAAAAFAIRTDRGAATLTLNTDREPRHAAAMGYAVTLVELRPMPATGAGTSTPYVATLVAERAP